MWEGKEGVAEAAAAAAAMAAVDADETLGRPAWAWAMAR